MFLKEFNQQPQKRIAKLNRLLNEQFDINFKMFPPKQKLQRLQEVAENAIIQIRGSNKKFHLEPEYAKYLGLRDLTNTMLEEGMYAESPAYEAMCNEVKERVRALMDSGCTVEEAASQCMNEYRRDDRWCYDDATVLPQIELACEEYMQETAESKNAVEDAVLEDGADTGLNSALFDALANEVGIATHQPGCLAAIEETLATFAEVTGKSRDAVVGFLNELDEDAIGSGIKMLGKKVAKENKFLKARKDAIKTGKKEFEVDGEKYPVQESAEQYFDNLISDILNEEVDVEQAEVVMAVRALGSDIQDQIERLGRMVNEDIPAIADQMRAEMGATQAQQWADATTQMIATYLDSAKATKTGMEQQVGALTGEGADMGAEVGGLGDTGEMGAADPAMGMGGEPEMGMEPEMGVDDVAAAAGPVDEPLGRAEV